MEIPIEDRRRLWTWRYAHLSFKRCEQSCSLILQQQLAKTDVNYLPLSVAALVLYARPFSKNYGMTKIPSTDLIPTTKLHLHHEILNARDKITAHMDVENREWSHGEPPLELYLVCKGNKVGVRATDITPKPSRIREIRDLARELMPKCDKKLDEWLKQWGAEVPTDGHHYRVNLQKGASFIFEHKPPPFD